MSGEVLRIFTTEERGLLTTVEGNRLPDPVRGKVDGTLGPEPNHAPHSRGTGYGDTDKRRRIRVPDEKGRDTMSERKEDRGGERGENHGRDERGQETVGVLGGSGRRVEREV